MSKCTHIPEIQAVTRGSLGCAECEKTGDSWVHLRMCLICGHVGCCDSSKNKHARAHYNETEHKLIRSVEPGEEWGYCYVDEAYFRAGE